MPEPLNTINWILLIMALPGVLYVLVLMNVYVISEVIKAYKEFLLARRLAVFEAYLDTVIPLKDGKTITRRKLNQMHNPVKRDYEQQLVGTPYERNRELEQEFYHVG